MKTMKCRKETQDIQKVINWLQKRIFEGVISFAPSPFQKEEVIIKGITVGIYEGEGCIPGHCATYATSSSNRIFEVKIVKKDYLFLLHLPMPCMLCHDDFWTIEKALQLDNAINRKFQEKLLETISEKIPASLLNCNLMYTTYGMKKVRKYFTGCSCQIIADQSKVEELLKKIKFHLEKISRLENIIKNSAGLKSINIDEVRKELSDVVVQLKNFYETLLKSLDPLEIKLEFLHKKGEIPDFVKLIQGHLSKIVHNTLRDKNLRNFNLSPWYKLDKARHIS